MYKPSIAIVCMIRDPAPSIKTWIDYHLQQVDRIFFILTNRAMATKNCSQEFRGCRFFPATGAA